MPKEIKTKIKQQVKNPSSQKTLLERMTNEPKPAAVIIEHSAIDEFIYDANIRNWHIFYSFVISVMMTINATQNNKPQPPVLNDTMIYFDIGLILIGINLIDLIYKRFIPVTYYDNELISTSEELIVTHNEVKSAEQKRQEAFTLSLLMQFALSLSNLYYYYKIDDLISPHYDKRHSFLTLIFNAFEIFKSFYSYSNLPTENLQLALKKRAEFFRDIFDDFLDENVRISISIHTGNSIGNSQIRIRAMDKESDHLILFTQRMKSALTKCGFNIDDNENRRIIAIDANFDIEDVDVQQVKTKLTKLYAQHDVLYTNIKALNKQLKHLAAKFPGIHLTTIPATQLCDTSSTFVLYIPQDYRKILTLKQWQQLFPEAHIEEIDERIHLKSNVPSTIYDAECQKLTPPELSPTMQPKTKNVANTNEDFISEGKQEKPFPAEKRQLERFQITKTTEKTPTDEVAAPVKRIQWNDQYIYQSDNEQCPIQPIYWPNGRVYPNHYAVFALKPEDMMGENADEMYETFAEYAKDSTLATSSKGASGIKLFSIATERRDPKTRQRYVPAAEIKILGNYGQKANRRVFGEMLSGPSDEKLIVWNHYDPDAHKNKLKS